MKKNIKAKALLIAILILGCNVLPVLAAPSGWTPNKPSGSVVSVYGSPASAIKSGPLYRSELYYQVSTIPNTNNIPFTVPSYSSFFELNDGWVLDYVSVAGNSSGQRQPGGTFLLASSGGSMLYYFRRE